MNAFKATVAHHQNLVTGLGFFGNHSDKFIHIGVHLRWLLTLFRDLFHRLRNVRRLVKVNRIGAVHRSGEGFFVHAQLHGGRARLNFGDDFLIAHLVT